MSLFRRSRPLPALGGALLAVWGTTGAPGASTVAVALAGALTPHGRVLLIDADAERGALRVLLHTGPAPTLARACARLPRGDAPWPRDTFYTHPGAGFDVLSGAPGPAAPVHLDPERVAAVLARARRDYDLIIADVGRPLDDGAAGALHRRVLRAADHVLAVGAATPLGLSDLLLQYPLLAVATDCVPADGRHSAVLNKAGRHGEDARRRVTRELGLPVAGVLPFDRALARAESRGMPLTVDRRHSPAATIVAGVGIRLWRTLAATPRVVETGQEARPGGA